MFAHDGIDVLDMVLMAMYGRRRELSSSFSPFFTLHHYELTLHHSGLAANQSVIPRCSQRLFSLGGGDVKFGMPKRESASLTK